MISWVHGHRRNPAAIRGAGQDLDAFLRRRDLISGLVAADQRFLGRPSVMDRLHMAFLAPVRPTNGSTVEGPGPEPEARNEGLREPSTSVPARPADDRPAANFHAFCPPAGFQRRGRKPPTVSQLSRACGRVPGGTGRHPTARRLVADLQKGVTRSSIMSTADHLSTSPTARPIRRHSRLRCARLVLQPGSAVARALQRQHGGDARPV